MKMIFMIFKTTWNH